ncbi:SWIM zinc finger domain-containing protein [Metabacillus herbersteinensis]|uniref:SWIM zinc finger domain-containing protein n=1 Tax=Metabacillus herbersteinensis TaxID=283816 RepID=A0ABV6GF65_9BACI
MLSQELGKERVLGAAEQIKHLLSKDDEHDRTLMKKGLILYRQGSIFMIKTTSDSVSARVQDVTSVEVKLDLDDFTMSTCTCPSDSICRHILATFLYVYATVDRVGTFVDRWKDDKKQPDILAHVRKASSLLRPEPEFNNKSLQSWLNFFDEEYELWREQISSPNNLVQSLYHHYYMKLKKKAPTSPEMKQFYNTQAATTVFIKMLQLINETKPSDYMLQHVYYPFIDQLIDAVSMAIREMKRYALPFALDPLLDESVERFRELLTCSTHYQYERLTLYRLLWTELLRRDKFILREREWLEEQQADELDRDLPKTVEYETALMHMDFLQSRDDDVFKRLSALPATAYPFMFEWVEDIVKKKNYQRLSRWVTHLIDSAPDYLQSPVSFNEKRSSIRYLINLLKENTDFTKKDAVFEELCAALLPYSYSEYDDYLLTKQQYRKWVELQTLLGFSIFELDRFVLKEAEKAEPGSLLPLYHQAVETEISMRTRENYKVAVRYLKRLKAIYKKLKNEPAWENYLHHLTEEHRRLRAFREELKKGKLIHA